MGVNSHFDEDEDPEADHEVGYRRPPKETRFKPGQSGNPKGRPKRPKSMEELIAQELNSKMTVLDGGRSRRVTKRELLVIALINDAIKGKPAARKEVVAHLLKYDPPRDPSGVLTIRFVGTDGKQMFLDDTKSGSNAPPSKDKK